MKQQILMHVTFFGQICDKPGIRIFIDEIEDISEFFVEDIKLICDHAIDDNGTHYFMHTLYNCSNGELPEVIITSATKDEINNIKQAMIFKSKNNKAFHVSMRATCLDTDEDKDFDDIKFDIYDEAIGIDVSAYNENDGSTKSADSMSAINLNGSSIAINDPVYDFYFHKSPIERFIEEQDDITIDRIPLTGKAQSFYEKMLLDQCVDEEPESTLSL